MAWLGLFCFEVEDGERFFHSALVNDLSKSLRPWRYNGVRMHFFFVGGVVSTDAKRERIHIVHTHTNKIITHVNAYHKDSYYHVHVHLA